MTERDPYQAITFRAKRDARKVAAVLGVHPGAIVLGLLDLWEHCQERRTALVGPLVLASCFGPDTRTTEVLAEFGFLEVLQGGQVRVKGAEEWLKTNEGRSRGGRASAGNLKQYRTGLHAGSSPAPAGREPVCMPAVSSGSPPASPSTQHPAPKEAATQSPRSASPPTLLLEPTPAKPERAPSKQVQLARELREQRRTLAPDLLPDESHSVAAVNAMWPADDPDGALACDRQLLLEGHALFLGDTKARGQDPPCRMWVFSRDWSKWVSLALKRRGAA